MKIALFHTTLPEPGRKLGGVEVAVHRLANELAREPGDEVTVFSLTPCPPDASYRHVHLFPRAPWLRDNRVARLVVLPFLLNTVKLEAFDVVHLHGDDWFYVRRRPATVRTLHGSALEEARAAKSLKRRLSQYAVYPLEHLSARLAREAMAIGPRTASIYGLRTLANNGVALDLFRPGPKAETPRVLFVGTWGGRKRGRFLFDVFTRDVLPRVPGAELVMVSDFCPDHPAVRAARFPSDEVLAQLYREAWVFAYPSVYEGFGIPYIEAMASGTAVVCTRNDGADYVLEKGTYGVVAPDADFGHRLVDLLTDAAERTRWEQRGLERAGTFSWAAVADQHRGVYRRAMGLPPAVAESRTGRPTPTHEQSIGH